jgi:hypothetical protein
MTKVGLRDFLDTIHGTYPNLKRYDETRLFAMLMQAGVDVEFDLDPDGNTMVSYPDITAEIDQKLKQF